MLSVEQQALWDAAGMDAALPAGDQTDEQAAEYSVATFQMLLALEGLPPMSDEEIVAERARR